MRKELLLAIIFGLFIGLIFAFGIFRINSVMRNKNLSTATDANQNQTADKKSDQQTQSISIFKPDNNSAFSNDAIQIAGLSRAESYIVISGGSNDTVQKSADDGSFSIDYSIDPAVNYLNVTSVSPDNERSSAKLNVAFSSEIPSTSSDQNTDTTQAANDKVQAAQKKLEFILGTVTDLTENGVQLKDTNGDIQQISYDEKSTSFAKYTTTTKKITASDIAIGDYVLAIGYNKSNNLIEAVRILVTQPETPQDVKIFYGTVTTKNRSDFEVDEKNSGKVAIEIDNNTKTYSGDLADPVKSRFANVSEDDTVIGTYTTEKDVNTARRIYILASPTPTPKS